MKLKEVVESKPALINLLKNSLPINIAWELKKIVNLIEPEVKAFEEIKNQKVIELGEESGNGIYNVKKENLNLFHSELNELISKEVDLNFNKIKIQDLLDYRDLNNKPVSISTSDLIHLNWLIE